jgi:hypothetical protein
MLAELPALMRRGYADIEEDASSDSWWGLYR